MPHEQDPAALEEVRSKVEKAYAAWLTYRNFTQERIDAIVEKMASAGREHARRLAAMAVEETSYGNADDKVAKNLLAAEWLPRAMRGMKTVGLLREIPEHKIVEYGVPVGVIAAIIPTTNPTSTVIYKTLISLKAGNGIVSRAGSASPEGGAGVDFSIIEREGGGWSSPALRYKEKNGSMEDMPCDSLGSRVFAAARRERRRARGPDLDVRHLARLDLIERDHRR